MGVSVDVDGWYVDVRYYPHLQIELFHTITIYPGSIRTLTL